MSFPNPLFDASRSSGESPACYALLGMLRKLGGQSHGYELTGYFSPGGELSWVIQINQAMLYHHLKRMANLGWIDIDTGKARSPVSRRTCCITATGREALADWMEKPVDHTRDMRLDFLLKLYFQIQEGPGAARDFVTRQHTRCLTLERALADELEMHTSDASDTFRTLVLSYRLAQTRTASQWLGQLLDDLATDADGVWARSFETRTDA